MNSQTCQCATGYRTGGSEGPDVSLECGACDSGFTYNLLGDGKCTRTYETVAEVVAANIAAHQTSVPEQCGVKDGQLCNGRGTCYHNDATAQFDCLCDASTRPVGQSDTVGYTATCDCPPFFTGAKCGQRCQKSDCSDKVGDELSSASFSGCLTTCRDGQTGCSACNSGMCVAVCTGSPNACQGQCKCPFYSGLVPATGYKDSGTFWSASKHGANCGDVCYSPSSAINTMAIDATNRIDWSTKLENTHMLEWLTNNAANAASSRMTYCAAAGGYCSTDKTTDGGGCKCSSAFDVPFSHYVTHVAGIQPGSNYRRKWSPACNMPKGAYSQTEDSVEAVYTNAQCSPTGNAAFDALGPDFSVSTGPDVCGHFYKTPVAYTSYGMVPSGNECNCVSRQSYGTATVSASSGVCCASGFRAACTVSVGNTCQRCNCVSVNDPSKPTYLQHLLRNKLSDVSSVNYFVANETTFSPYTAKWAAYDHLDRRQDIFDTSVPGSMALRSAGVAQSASVSGSVVVIVGTNTTSVGMQWSGHGFATGDMLAIIRPSSDPDDRSSVDFTSTAELAAKPSTVLHHTFTGTTLDPYDFSSASTLAGLQVGQNYRMVYVPKDAAQFAFYYTVANFQAQAPTGMCPFEIGSLPANTTTSSSGQACVNGMYYPPHHVCPLVGTPHAAAAYVCQPHVCGTNGQFSGGSCQLTAAPTAAPTGTPTGTPTSAPTSETSDSLILIGVNSDQFNVSQQTVFRTVLAGQIQNGVSADDIQILATIASNGSVTQTSAPNAAGSFVVNGLDASAFNSDPQAVTDATNAIANASGVPSSSVSNVVASPSGTSRRSLAIKISFILILSAAGTSAAYVAPKEQLATIQDNLKKSVQTGILLAQLVASPAIPDTVAIDTTASLAEIDALEFRADTEAPTLAPTSAPTTAAPTEFTTSYVLEWHSATTDANPCASHTQATVVDDATECATFLNGASASTALQHPSALIAYHGEVSSSASAGQGCQVNYNQYTAQLSGHFGVSPTAAPTPPPTDAPTSAPSSAPTSAPTDVPTSAPTSAPTDAPTSHQLQRQVPLLLTMRSVNSRH